MQGSLPAAALVFSYSYWIAKLSWLFLKELKGLDLKTVMYSLPSSIAPPSISHHKDEGKWRMNNDFSFREHVYSSSVHSCNSKGGGYIKY